MRVGTRECIHAKMHGPVHVCMQPEYARLCRSLEPKRLAPSRPCVRTVYGKTEAAAYRGHEGTFLPQLIVHCLGQRNDALCHVLRRERSVRRARLPPANLPWVCARMSV